MLKLGVHVRNIRVGEVLNENGIRAINAGIIKKNADNDAVPRAGLSNLPIGGTDAAKAGNLPPYLALSYIMKL